MLPTYQQCEEMAKNPVFLRKEEIVEGFRVVTFSYRLASPVDFFEPLKGEEVDGLEMRGITFVQQEDGSFSRFLFINKFFNLNETKGWMAKDLANEELECVMDKRDGSAIGFYQLPNGKVRAKTKFGLSSEIVDEVEQFLSEERNQRYIHFVKSAFATGYHPLFEWTTPKRRIVLNYPKESLVLLGIRDEQGRYLPYNEVQEVAHGIPMVEQKNVSIDEMLDLAKTEKNIEGWVARTVSGKSFKIKTEWYLSLHHLVSGEIHDASLISMILNETIDDFLSDIPKDFKDLRAHVENLSAFISHAFQEKVNSVCQIADSLRGLDRKVIAQKVKGSPYMSAIINQAMSEKTDIESVGNQVVNQIKKETLKKERAGRWLKNEGFHEWLKKMRLEEYAPVVVE